ncbi:hypothetical protein BDR04DRAFT_1145191 [Suillus decipiens]|nr:hypothetical protein BDR04DRAFT_1145191 [Suillus decipiens]
MNVTLYTGMGVRSDFHQPRNSAALSISGRLPEHVEQQQSGTRILFKNAVNGFFHKRDRFSVLSPSESAEATKRSISTEGIKVETAVTISTLHAKRSEKATHLTTKNETGWAVVYEADQEKMLHISTLSGFRQINGSPCLPYLSGVNIFGAIHLPMLKNLMSSSLKSQKYYRLSGVHGSCEGGKQLAGNDRRRVIKSRWRWQN